MITYNHEKYIKEAIDGVLMQKCNFDFEFIIVNDFSSDNTDLIINSTIKNLKNKIKIRYINQPSNIGMISNFVFGLNQANAKYIALCEGDDYWTDPFKLQKQVDFMEANTDYSVCFHEVDKVRDGAILGKYTVNSRTKYTIEDLFNWHFIATCSIIFRNYITFPTWYNKVASGDKLLLFLCALKGDIGFLPETMGCYRLHSGGISNTHNGIKKVLDMSILLQLFNELTLGKYDEYCKKSLMYEIEDNIISKLPKNKRINEINTIMLLNELIRRFFFKLGFRKFK